MTITISVRPVSGDLRRNAKAAEARMDRAISAASNMVASMMMDEYKKRIAESGNFGARWTQGLHVVVTTGHLRVQIKTFHDIPFANVFEDGATISGNLLWVPLSGTDAKDTRPKDYPGGLFSVSRTRSGRPLLFSIADKKPKYFGIEQVTIPPKWQLQDAQNSIMANFRAYYDAAYKNAGAGS